MITKTAPYKHQRTAYEIMHGKPYYANLMEMGTGKTWVTLVDATNEFLEGNIDLLLVVAPNGVHRSWIVDQVPSHVPLEKNQYIAHYWQANASKGQKLARAELLEATRKLKIFAINAEALSTAKGKAFFDEITAENRTFIVIDEANQIMKNPKALRTKALLKSAKNNKNLRIRRILTGTPITQGVFDLYAPFKFLSSGILGFPTYTGFKYEFGTFVTMEFRGKKPFQKLTGYKNLEKLKEYIKPYSYRVLKKDCLDLPEKIYEKIYVDMLPEQRKVYNQLRDDFVVELLNKKKETGCIDAPLALTRLLRLQQIVGGFVPVEMQDKTSKLRFDNNPKVAAVKNIIENLAYDAFIIIWCRFTDEIKALQEIYKEVAVTYFGECSNDEKAAAIEQFQNTGVMRIFIANQQCAGLGLTLTKASTVIYFSNSFSYSDRTQSEDRCHRIGQKNNVTYIDLVCVDTVDDKTIMPALREKKNMANYITGDEVTDWI